MHRFHISHNEAWTKWLLRTIQVPPWFYDLYDPMGSVMSACLLLLAWQLFGGRASATFIMTYTHYRDVMISAMASQITGVSIVRSAVCSGADQGKHQSSASLALVRGIHRCEGNGTGDRWIPLTKGQQRVSIWWRHGWPKLVIHVTLQINTNWPVASWW